MLPASLFSRDYSCLVCVCVCESVCLWPRVIPSLGMLPEGCGTLPPSPAVTRPRSLTYIYTFHFLLCPNCPASYLPSSLDNPFYNFSPQPCSMRALFLPAVPRHVQGRQRRPDGSTAALPKPRKAGSVLFPNTTGGNRLRDETQPFPSTGWTQKAHPRLLFILLSPGSYVNSILFGLLENSRWNKRIKDKKKERL